MWRSTVVFIIIIIWASAIIVKLFFWQVLSYERLASEADSQHFVTFSLPSVRGDILTSDGSILVTNQPAYLVYAEPNKIKDKDSFSEFISKSLDIDKASVSAQIKDSNQLWVPLAKRVEEERIEKIKEKKIEGIGFEKMGRRFYPEASMSAHLLGFVASDNRGEDKGYFGLEGFYDKELRGREGILRQEKDPYGNPIIIGEAERIDPDNGRILKLHLDKVVQLTIEDNLKKGIEKYGAKGGVIVVMDPSSGAILGMASFPSYDMATYFDFPKEIYKNPIVGESYEPGSTFKALIMAAALNEKAVEPKTIVDESGPVNISGYSIRTWNNKYRGEINMIQILQHSSNVGMVQVARKIGKEKMIDYIKKFGFGKETNIDLEDELVPELRDDEDWKEIDLATASFGQGIAVTPIQMVSAISVLANGGKLMEPHVVDEIIDREGSIVKIKPKVIREVIRSGASKVITEMLVSSVEAGEAHYSLPKGFKIAGKTGTAQIPVSGHYDEEKTIASFVGFAPADEPKFAMLVAITEPTSSPWGSETAAPLFIDIAKDLLAYYKVFPKP